MSQEEADSEVGVIAVGVGVVLTPTMEPTRLGRLLHAFEDVEQVAVDRGRLRAHFTPVCSVILAKPSFISSMVDGASIPASASRRSA
jgi:hypothetical protein